MTLFAQFGDAGVLSYSEAVLSLECLFLLALQHEIALERRDAGFNVALLLRQRTFSPCKLVFKQPFLCLLLRGEHGVEGSAVCERTVDTNVQQRLATRHAVALRDECVGNETGAIRVDASRAAFGIEPAPRCV